MDESLFSGFIISSEMADIQKTPPPSKYAVTASPSLKASKASKLDGLEALDGFVEPILRPNPTRFTLFPIEKPKLFHKFNVIRHKLIVHTNKMTW